MMRSEDMVTFVHAIISLYIEYAIVAPFTLMVSIITVPFSFSVWCVNIYMQSLLAVIHTILHPVKTTKKVLRKAGLLEAKKDKLSVDINSDFDADSFLPNLVSPSYTIQNAETAPAPPLKTNDIELKKQYEWMQGYVIVVDSYEADNAPVFKPSMIPKLLKKAKPARAGETAASKKKRIQRENLYYARFSRKEGALRFYQATDGEILVASSPLNKTDSTQHVKNFSLDEYTVNLFPEDLAPNRYFTHTQPLELQGKDDDQKKHYVFFPTNIEKEIWYLSLMKFSAGDISFLSNKRLTFLNLCKQLFGQSSVNAASLHDDEKNESHNNVPGRRKLFNFRGRRDQKSVDLKTDAQLPPVKIDTSKIFDVSWVNLLLARMWVNAMDSDKLHTLIESRIIRQMSKIKRPGFISDISLKAVTIGKGIPLLHNMGILSFSEYCDAKLTFDIIYNGNFSIEIEAEAQFEVGGRKAKFVLRLKVTLNELAGKIVLKTNPSPSNRLWWAFETAPRYSLSVLPLVGETNVGFNLVKDTIEKKFHDVITDTIVLPNMEDIPLFGDNAKNPWEKQDTFNLDVRIGSPGSENQETNYYSDTESIDQSDTSSVHNMPFTYSEPNYEYKGIFATLTGISPKKEDAIDYIAAAAANIPSLNLSPTTARRNSLSPPSVHKGKPSMFYNSPNFIKSQSNLSSPTSPSLKDGVLRRVSSARQKWFPAKGKKEGSKESL